MLKCFVICCCLDVSFQVLGDSHPKSRPLPRDKFSIFLLGHNIEALNFAGDAHITHLPLLLWHAWDAGAEGLNWSDPDPRDQLESFFIVTTGGREVCWPLVGREARDAAKDARMHRILQRILRTHTRTIQCRALLGPGDLRGFDLMGSAMWQSRTHGVAVHSLSLQTPSRKQSQGSYLLSSPWWAALHRRALGSHWCTGRLGAEPSCSAGCRRVPWGRKQTGCHQDRSRRHARREGQLLTG